MNIHRVTVAKVEQYSGIESEQQCHHDIVLDGIVGIGPVNRSTIGYSATIVVAYDREHNNRLSLHFPFYGKANEARDELVAAWKALKAQPPVAPVPPKEQYITVSNYSGTYEVPVCLTGIRNMNPVEGNEAEPASELYLTYADGRNVQYSFANARMLQLAVNTINLALIRES